jgi:hypothetical protein
MELKTGPQEINNKPSDLYPIHVHNHLLNFHPSHSCVFIFDSSLKKYVSHLTMGMQVPGEDVILKITTQPICNNSSPSRRCR